MNVYEISCYSKCNSYFKSYLQSITVVAANEEDAIRVVKKSRPYKNYKFIYPEKEWDIRMICMDIQNNTVIDYVYDSDY